MSEPGRRTPERTTLLGGLLLALGVVITAAGLVAVGSTLINREAGDGATGPNDVDTAAPSATAQDDGTAASPSALTVDVAAPQAPLPIGIRIPVISVDADMIPLGIRDDGSIEVPADFSRTGWWADGPEPGETGPSVVLGHVDSRTGPAVFYSLTDLAPGDEVIIDRADGSSVTYRVDRIEQHSKDRFPTQAVYGDTPDPELRLVTCGGDFDRSERSYRDNIVVFARMA